MPGKLSSQHHALIQALLARGPLEENEFYSIFSHVTGKSSGRDRDQRALKKYLLEINRELNFVQFELRACLNQYSGNVYYGVVNNVSDEQSKLGTRYAVPQIAFYKGIIEAIVQDKAGQGSISTIDALNIKLEDQVPTEAASQSQGYSSQIPTAFKNFSLSQKEKTLEEFFRDQWLCSTSDGQIGLGARSFLDLRSWFHNNEIPTCEVCNEAAVKAELCQNEGCSIRIHPYCLKKKFSQKRVERVCPGCGTPWHSVGKFETVEEDDDLRAPSQNLQSPNSSGRKRQRSSQQVGRKTEESRTCVTSQSLCDTRRVTRSSSRLSSV